MRIIVPPCTPCNDCCCIFFDSQNYFGDPWNVLDFVIVVGSLVDIVAAQVMVCHPLSVGLYMTHLLCLRLCTMQSVLAIVLLCISVLLMSCQIVSVKCMYSIYLCLSEVYSQNVTSEQSPKMSRLNTA